MPCESALAWLHNLRALDEAGVFQHGAGMIGGLQPARFRPGETEKEGGAMEELYRAIEEKIRLAGYPGDVDGFEIYDDICSQIEDKENGNYILISKKTDELWYEYQLSIMDEDFNLSVLTIHRPEKDYRIDFD